MKASLLWVVGVLELLTALILFGRGASDHRPWRKRMCSWLPNWWDTPSDRFAFFVALFTFALAAVAVFQWLALDSTDRAIHAQLTVMQRQLDDSQIREAASLTIRNFRIDGFPDNTVAVFDVVNSGKSRADLVSFDPAYKWAKGEKRYFDLIGGDNKFGGRLQASEFGFSIDPSDPPKHLEIPMRIPPQKAIGEGDRPAEFEAMLPTREEVISGRTTSVIYVWGTYRDIFGKTHHVVDCLAYVQPKFLSCFGSNRYYEQQAEKPSH